MSKPVSPSPALPLAHFALRVLLVMNWAMVAVILIMLFALPNERWIMSAFDLTPSPEAERLVMGMRFIAALGLVAVPFNYVVLKRLLAIVQTVRDGDPFVAVNATRLQTIAWALLALQLLSMVIGGIARVVEIPGRPLNLDAGFSMNALARGLPGVPAGASVRGRDQDARRARGDGLTWRSWSSSTTCCTSGA